MKSLSSNLSRSFGLPHLLVFLLGSAWGLSISLIKIASEAQLPYLVIMLVVSGFSLALQSSIAWYRRSLPRFNNTALSFYAICAVTSVLLPHLIELWVAEHIAAGVLSLIITTTPIFTLIFAYSFGSKKVSGKNMAGIFLGCASVLFIVLPQSSAELDFAHLQYILIALLIPAAYGGYHTYVDHNWPKGMVPIQAGSGEMVIGVAIVSGLLLLQLLWQGEALSQAVVQISVDQWLLIIAMGLLATLSAILYFMVQYLAGAVFTAQANYVTTVAGVFWGMMIFAEPLSAWVGLSVITLIVASRLIDPDQQSREEPVAATS